MDSTRLVNPIGGGKRLDYNDLAKAFGMLAIIWAISVLQDGVMRSYMHGIFLYFSS